MEVNKISAKGQIVVPVALREKYGLKPNSYVRITEIDGHIAIIPVPDDPIKVARGMLRGGKSATRHMADIRADEREIEKKQSKGRV